MNNKIGNTILCLSIYGVALLFFFGQDLSYPSNVFPYAILLLMTITSTIILIRTYTGRNQEENKEESSSEIEYAKIIFVMVISLIYVSLINYLGFYVSSFLYVTVLLFKLQEEDNKLRKKLITSISYSIFLCIFVYVAFDMFLRVPLPKDFIM